MGPFTHYSNAMALFCQEFYIEDFPENDSFRSRCSPLNYSFLQCAFSKYVGEFQLQGGIPVIQLKKMRRETVSRTNMAIEQPVPANRTLKAPMDVEQEHIPYHKVFGEGIGNIFQTNAEIIAGIHAHGFPFFGSS